LTESFRAAAERLPFLKVVFDPYEAVRGAHAAVVVSEWEEVRTLELKRAGALMEKPKALVDGRNAFEPALALEAGLCYRGIGRG
jgi:UDPglucose 6-dehydrogenase